MRKNRIIILVAVLLVIVSFTLLLTRKSGTYRSKDKDFAVQDTSLVNKIFLANKNDYTVLLERTSPGAWILNSEHEVSQYMINLFLETIYRIKTEQPLPKASVENIIKRLSVVAVKVEIYGTAYKIDFLGLKLFPYEKLLKCYYVGDATQDNMGTYMLMEGSNMPFIVSLPGFRGYVASRYQVLPDQWRTQTVFKAGANEIASISLINHDDPAQSFIIDTNVPIGKFSFTTYERTPSLYPIDTFKVYNYLNSFKRINFESFLDNQLSMEQMDSILKTTPRYEISLKHKTGEVQNLKIFPIIYRDIIDLQTGENAIDFDRAYAYMDDGKLVLIQYFMFDRILRDRSYFYLSPSQK